MDQYELYLSREEWEKLNARRNELSSHAAHIALEVAKYDFDSGDFCRFYPDIACMVEIARVLNYIPRHYHTPLADALREDGWTERGRERRPNTRLETDAADGAAQPCY